MTAIDDQAFAAALLARLRAELELPGLSYCVAPVRLTGGFDTLTVRFTLAGAAKPFDGPLVARIFREADGARRAEAEAPIHKAVAGQGYPAPPILHRSGRDEPPGAFLVMPFVPGTTLLKAMGDPRMLWRVPRLLASWHARLHALDPSHLEDANPTDGTAGWLAMIAGQVAGARARGFEDGFAWLQRNVPASSRRAILHMDFHPGNVMVERDAVTGVLDWAHPMLGDPAADVGTTRVLLTMGPVDVPQAIAPLVNGVRRWMAWRYLAEYQKIAPLDADAVRYYEALRCYMAMLHVALRRKDYLLARREQYAWDGPQQIRAMTVRFHDVTGIALPVEH